MTIKTGFFNVFAKIMVFCVAMTGVFFAPAYAAFPAGYTELEYIKSTGTQWIDTGVVPNFNYTFEVKAIKYMTKSLIGVTAGISYSLTGDGANNYLWRRNKFDLPNTIDSNAVHVWAVRDNKLWCDDINVDAPAPSNYNTEASVSWTLFARHIDGGDINDIGPHTIYYAKIWNDNGTLVRNFVPAKRNSDNVIGMYDTVNGVFYTNAGTGEFIAGSAVIKIATTAYSDTQFAPVETALAGAVDTIKGVVETTITQTAAVADLQENKQTRPDSECPAGKKCLLVEDVNGVPHWYEIIEEYIPPEPTPVEP